MRFGGFQKNTLIDYPGKIASLLFTIGCNFHCPYCHNPEIIPLNAEESHSEEEIVSFLKKRKGLIEGVVITGGEPCLQKDLKEFCLKVKELGYPVKLDSNGSRPEVLKELIEAKLIDFIAMDIKTEPAFYHPLLSSKDIEEELKLSIKLIIESGINHEFRTTCVYPFVTKERISNCLPLIKGADNFVLQRFSSRSLLSPSFFEKTGRGLEKNEIEELLEIIKPYVKKSELR